MGLTQGVFCIAMSSNNHLRSMSYDGEVMLLAHLFGVDPSISEASSPELGPVFGIQGFSGFRVAERREDTSRGRGCGPAMRVLVPSVPHMVAALGSFDLSSQPWVSLCSSRSSAAFALRFAFFGLSVLHMLSNTLQRK